jgi:hypothetical protein
MAEPRKRKARAKPGQGKALPPTRYVVLEMKHLPAEEMGEEPKEAWTVIGEEDTRTEKQAIDKVRGSRGGTFRAVAHRSWKGSERLYEQTQMTRETLEG